MWWKNGSVLKRCEGRAAQRRNNSGESPTELDRQVILWALALFQICDLHIAQIKSHCFSKVHRLLAVCASLGVPEGVRRVK